MSGARRLEMNRHHPDLSLACQCALLGISRSSLYYQPTQAKVKDLELMTLMDRQYLKTPFYGSRRMSVWLRREGYLVNRKRVRRLMRVMGIEAIYRRPNTSRPSPENKVYPYLLRGLEVSGVNQVWMADITYIPMARGFLYLVAIMDWYSRYVLAWRLSNTLDADFCVDGLEEALRQGKPEIFNTDQGSQFTSEAFTSMLLEHGIRISMDGKGRYMDNIFVERLWRSVKYEEVYLKAYQNVPEARAGIGAYLRFYNHERPHQALGYQTPQEIFEEGQGWRCLHEQGLALPSNLETTSPVMVPTKPAEDSLNLALSLSKQWGPLHISDPLVPDHRKGLGSLKADLHPSLQGKHLDSLDRSRVGKFAQLPCVGLHRLDLTAKEIGDVHVEVWLKGVLRKGRRLICGGWHFIGEQPGNLMLRDSSASYQRGLEDRAVVLV